MKELWWLTDTRKIYGVRFDGTSDLHDTFILHGNSVRRSGMP